MSKTKMKSFVKQFTAFVKGDDISVRAEKAFRQCSSTLTAQISVLTGDTVSLEDRIEDAQSKLDLAMINNGEPIGDNREQYISNLLSAKNNLTKAKNNLELHVEKIKFLSETLVALSTETEE